MASAAEESATMDEGVDYSDAYEGAGDNAAGADGDGGAPDADLAQLHAMLDDMETNQAKISEASTAASLQASSAVAAKTLADQDRVQRDERSVFVGSVDFSTTGEELMAYFSSCGTIERVTILSDKFGNPKGFAYIEFTDKSAVDNAIILNDTEFKGRKLKITPKRTNVPSHTLRGGRGGGGARPFRGGRGHFAGGGGGYAPRGGRGGYFGGPPARGGRGGFRGGYVPRGRGRGGGGAYYGQ